MYVEEIDQVKKQLSALKDKKIISEWELPYENLLTRLSAAIFFVEFSGKQRDIKALGTAFSAYPNYKCEENADKEKETPLSKMAYRITFPEDITNNG